MLFRDMPIQKKLMSVILLISGIILLVTSLAFFGYEFYAFRQNTTQKLSTLGKIIATNSTAALAFDNNKDAYEILLALKAEPNIIAASLYDEKGNLFSQYPGNLATNNFPVSPGMDGFRFTGSYLEGFQQVAEGNRRLGTLYLKSDLGGMYQRFRLFGITTILVIAISLLLAYLLSKIFQKSISRPILALAEAAKTISVNRDFSVRAVKSGNDELGSLTDSFNEMLQQIQEQNNNLKESNQKLDKSEKQYHYLFENSPMPMWVIDLNTFKFLDVNEIAILQYGYTRQEFLSMTTLDIRPDEGKELFKQAGHLFEMSRTNYSKGIWNHRKKDGTIIQVETIGHRIIFEGVPARLILSNDVTERKKAEEKLDKSEKLFRAMIEKGADMKALATPDGKVFYASPSITKILGYKNQELMATPLFDLIHPDDVAEFAKRITAIVQMPGKSFHRQQRLKHKNGTWLWCEGTVTNMLHEPAVAALVSNFRDITYRKRAEQDINEARDLTDKLIDSLPGVFYFFDSTGKFIRWNRHFEEVTGYSAEEIAGMHPTAFFGEDEKQYITERIEGVFLKGVNDAEASFLTKKGKKIPYYFKAVLINYESGPCLLGNGIDITERKKFEEELALAASIVNSSDDAILSKAPDGIITSWNQGAKKTFGYSSKEIIGRHISILIPSHLQNEENEIMEKIHSGKSIVHYETERVKKDGKVIHVSLTISPVKDSLGRITGVSKICRDITERKKTEDLLIKSEKQYRNLFENNPMPMWVIDSATFKFLDVNEAAISHYEYGREEFLSMTSLDIRPEEEKEHYRNADRFENIYPAKYNRGIWKHLKKDRTVIDVEVFAHEIFFEGKKGRLVLSNDITKRIRAEEEIQKLNEELEDKVIDRTIKLQKSNELFSKLFNHNPASIAISSIVDGNLIDVNDSFLLLNGYSSKEEVVGKTSAELNMPVEPEQRAEIARLLKENKYIKNYEVNVYDKQGNKKWIQLSAIVLEIDNVPCLLSVSIDISDRKKTEEQLMSVNKELEAFSYSVSHDLRAPLRAINGFAKMLGGNYSTVFDNEGKRLFNRIEENAKKMGSLIDDLLEFSRLGRKEIQKSPIQMTELVEAVLLEINTTTNHEAAIKIHQLHSVNADSTMIKQVMINLLSNAIKYSSKTEKPSIEIKSYLEENEIIYTVSDNGVGFNNQFVHKLFGVFQRLHLQADFDGTGVGLALVKRIINKHGGRVWAAGELNKGATFCFSLPETTNN